MKADQRDIRIRPVDAGSEEELTALSRFASEIVKEHFDPLIGAAQNDYMIARFQSVEAIRAQLKEGYLYYLITLRDEWAGYFAVVPEGERMLLSKFYVHRRFRGQGLSGAEFSFIRELAREKGARVIYLHVNRGNEGPIAVYRHLGFTVARQSRTDIGGGFVMDDYEMEYVVT